MLIAGELLAMPLSKLYVGYDPELFDMTEEELCTLLNIEDYDESEPRFIDYVDAGLRAIKHIGNIKKQD